MQANIFKNSFITPEAHELPPHVRVLTTTRVLPDASKKMPEALSVQAQPLFPLSPRGRGCPEGAGEGERQTFYPSPPAPLPQGERGAEHGASFSRLNQIRSNEIHWPPTSHAKGAALESAFAQCGHALHHFLPTPPLWLQQVHGIDVVKIDDSISASVMRQTPPVADAAVTCTPDVVLAVLTADCLPIVIACENSHALAIAHAGWRGLADGVLENTVRCLVAMSSSPTKSLMVWLGPAIGPAAFEVGEDVYTAFDATRDDETASCFTPTGSSGKCVGKWHADLYALARLRLRRLGISKISGGSWCTYSDAQRFFSYRRQRDEKRMATLAWISGGRGQVSGIRNQI
ncbi:MAG: peptidoglycan editing factor PgeF [Burkholderiales bacterium]|jgi:YfiH family protein|nr:peptidoglycan editing factor PgeF [Burkholderiales bacterium]